MKTLAGEIRMIKFGIIPDLPSFSVIVGKNVGGKENNLTVVAIVAEPVLDGKCEYHISCAKKDDKGNFEQPFIWKTYKKEPDEIQYFVPDEKHNYLKV